MNSSRENNFFIDSIDLVFIDGTEYIRQVKKKKSNKKLSWIT